MTSDPPLTRLCGAVLRFEGQPPLPCNLPADHPGKCEFGASESMRHGTAALDGLASNGPASAYAQGYQAGRVEAFAQQAATAVESATSELELLAAGGYTAEQQARADACAASATLLAPFFGRLSSATDLDGQIAEISGAWLAIACEAAHQIEHGFEFLDEEELKAVKQAEPRTRPPHLQPTTSRGFAQLPPIPGNHGGQPAGQVAVWESSAAAGPHLWISASHPSDRNDPHSTPVEGCVHIRAEDAWRFADQIRYLVEHHYQGSAIPAAEPPQT